MSEDKNKHISIRVVRSSIPAFTMTFGASSCGNVTCSKTLGSKLIFKSVAICEINLQAEKHCFAPVT